jgi:hypothetical protein
MPNVKINELAAELDIRIGRLNRSDIPVIIFLVIWLAGWTLGELFALFSLFAPSTWWPIRIFFLIWVIPWSIGGGYAILSLVKLMGGYERVEAGRGILSITRSYLFFRLTKRYDIFKISALRKLNKSPDKFAVFNKGMIQFRYEDREIRFGERLTPAGKDEVLRALKAHKDFSERNFL